MTEMRDINVQDQAKLSIQKVYGLVRSGIKHRLLRSTLTMSVILLAVAFFMATLSENVIINAVAGGVNQEIYDERRSIYLLNHLYTKSNSIAFSQKLAKDTDNPTAIAEYAAVTGEQENAVQELANNCRLEQQYLSFFANMSIGNRKMLIGNRDGAGIFAYLADSNNYNDFKTNLEPLRALKLPTDESQLQGLINNYSKFEQALNKFLNKWNNKVATLDQKTKALIGDQELNAWFCHTEDLQSWKQTVESLHFNIDDTTLGLLHADMKKQFSHSEVTKALLSPELKKEWQTTFLVKEPLEKMLARLHSKDVVELINKHLSRPYSHEELSAIASNVEYNKDLSALESGLSKHTSKKSGSVLSGRQTFLLIISFIVCMVGIANAMLMAITERFREIATMKCLGATDSFILIQFMMEAAIQGVVGGIFGMVIGFILALLKTSFGYGLYPFVYFPFLALVICAGISLVIGIILAVLASLYPSWAASRMAPMEAMRVE